MNVMKDKTNVIWVAAIAGLILGGFIALALT
jgi:uncharacterized protein involved in exopolysaccharide biosynthesis